MRARLRAALTALWISLLIALVANLVVLTIGRALNGGAIVVDNPGVRIDVSWIPVIVVTTLASVVAALGAGLLAFWFRIGVLVFVVLGVMIGGLSILAVTNALSVTGAVSLGVLHVTTTAILVSVNAILQARVTAADGF